MAGSEYVARCVVAGATTGSPDLFPILGKRAKEIKECRKEVRKPSEGHTPPAMDEGEKTLLTHRQRGCVAEKKEPSIGEDIFKASDALFAHYGL